MEFLKLIATLVALWAGYTRRRYSWIIGIFIASVFIRLPTYSWWLEVGVPRVQERIAIDIAVMLIASRVLYGAGWTADASVRLWRTRGSPNDA